MSVPSPWVALILLAAAYRIWRLLSEDDILDIPRRKLVRLPLDWEEGEPIDNRYRVVLAQFISCPWCLGFWITIAIWGLWQANGHWTEVLAIPFALSAGVGAANKWIGED